ncbi:ABC transporter permease [Aquibacillus saliphilus]|uniref:ABC transporter permease n=1 Tax=Aquibacillus saliphilus TaxID=1909422 RepID=UPI001CF0313B|nr:ABC transporter permease [Aquibacillus saliphilus]
MLSFLKKDVLVLLRDRTELIVLLLMPIILTIILGFALKGMFGGGYSESAIEVAIVDENNAEQGVEQFLEDVSQLPIPDQAKTELNEAVMSIEPSTMLKEVFQSEDVSELFQMHDLDQAAAEDALEQEDIVAFLIVSEDFTYQSLTNMLLEQGEKAELKVVEGTHESLSAGVFHDIIDNFVKTLNLETAIAQAAKRTDVSAMTESEVNRSELGGQISATNQAPVTSMEYYTIGIAVMFALFVASTIASKAYVETYQHVFDRILLSGKHPFLYLSGKALSTAIIVFVQGMIMFLIARFVLQAFSEKSLDFWFGMLVIFFFYSICVGALAALLTSITLKFKSAAVPGIFAGGIVMILSLVGGSFFPVSTMPDLFDTLGSWTPNGMTLNAILQWSQGLGTEYLKPLIGRMLAMTVIIFVVSLLFFSKRKAI